jgi:quercetin dioxygenase-like cupin family protein
MAYRTMSRWSVLLLVLGLALTAGGASLAQSATPAAEPIAITMLGKGLPANAPGNYLELDRVTIAPGASIPTHVHPGAYVLYVESGDFGFTVIKGTAQLTKAGATTPQDVQPGVETVGHAGDAFFENGGVVHTARNAGTTPVVLLTAGLLANDQPSLQPSNAEGTPSP